MIFFPPYKIKLYEKACRKHRRVKYVMLFTYTEVRARLGTCCPLFRVVWLWGPKAAAWHSVWWWGEGGSRIHSHCVLNRE